VQWVAKVCSQDICRTVTRNIRAVTGLIHPSIFDFPMVVLSPIGGPLLCDCISWRILRILSIGGPRSIGRPNSSFQRSSLPIRHSHSSGRQNRWSVTRKFIEWHSDSYFVRLWWTCVAAILAFGRIWLGELQSPYILDHTNLSQSAIDKVWYRSVAEPVLALIAKSFPHGHNNDTFW